MSRIRYAIPNFFTSLNFLMGTFSVVLAPLGTQKMSFLWGEKTALEWAGWLIVYSVLLDKLDGFFAKRLKASSAFGAEFDSLADLIAFGLAPAMLFFHGLRAISPQWAAENVPIQILGLSFYVLCAAWRLARYNVAQTGLKDYFVGMPSTLSGGFAALTFLIAYKWTNGVFSGTLASALVATQILQAGLMISGFYISKLVSRQSKAFNTLQIVCVVIGYILGLLMIFPEFLFSLIAIYSAVGFTYGIIRRSRIKAALTTNPEG